MTRKNVTKKWVMWMVSMHLNEICFRGGGDRGYIPSSQKILFRKMIRRWNLRVTDDRRQCRVSSSNDDIHSLTTAMSRKIDELIVGLQESKVWEIASYLNFLSHQHEKMSRKKMSNVNDSTESSTWRCWWLRKLAVFQHFVIVTYDRTSECTDLEIAQRHLFTKKSRKN